MEEEKTSLHNSLKLIVKTSFIVLIGLILSKLFSYAYRIIIARQFGPEVYGLFSLGLMIFTFFIAISSLGMVEGILRYLSFYRGKNEKGKIRYLLNFAFKVLFFSGLFSSLLLFLLSTFISIEIFHNADLIVYLRVFSLMILISIFTNAFLSVIRAYEKIKWYSFIQNIVLNVLKVFFLISFILLGFSASSAVNFSYFLGVFGTFILAYLICKIQLSKIIVKNSINERQKKEVISRLMSYSWPIIFLSVLGSLLYWIDSFTIGYFKSVTDVGYYNAAVPLAALFDMALFIFILLLFPLITKEYSRNNLELIKNLIKQVGKWIFVINLPLFFLVFFFPEAILSVFFGKEYLAAINVLRILSLGALVYSVGSVSYNLLLMIGKSRLVFFDILIFSILNFILNFILVPVYGINGAAFSTMLCYTVLAITFIAQANRYLKIVPIRKKMLNVFVATFIPSMAILFLRKLFPTNVYSLILLSIIFVILYAIFILLFRGLDKNDLLIIKSIKDKFLKTKDGVISSKPVE